MLPSKLTLASLLFFVALPSHAGWRNADASCRQEAENAVTTCYSNSRCARGSVHPALPDESEELFDERETQRHSSCVNDREAACREKGERAYRYCIRK